MFKNYKNIDIALLKVVTLICVVYEHLCHSLNAV